MKSTNDITKVYDILENKLKKFAVKHNLLVKKNIIDSKAKVDKKQIHLYGKNEVSIFNRPDQKIYVAGIMLNKGYVGLYLMPYYSFPKKFDLSESIQKKLKGKSCFHIKEINPEIDKEIDKLIELGIKLYKKERWV